MQLFDQYTGKHHTLESPTSPGHCQSRTWPSKISCAAPPDNPCLSPYLAGTSNTKRGLPRRCLTKLYHALKWQHEVLARNMPRLPAKKYVQTKPVYTIWL